MGKPAKSLPPVISSSYPLAPKAPPYSFSPIFLPISDGSALFGTSTE